MFHCCLLVLLGTYDDKHRDVVQTSSCPLTSHPGHHTAYSLSDLEKVCHAVRIEQLILYTHHKEYNNETFGTIIASAVKGCGHSNELSNL